MTLLTLCFEFLKVGLFTVGGGLAALPFLTQMSVRHPDWFSLETLANMVAVAESTPGPLGINMATYVGYTVAGVAGAVLASLTMITPSLVIAVLVSQALARFRDNDLVSHAFTALRAAVAGLIMAAGYSLLSMTLYRAPAAGAAFLTGFHWPSILVFAAFVVLVRLKPLEKLHPVAFIALGAAAGMTLGL